MITLTLNHNLNGIEISFSSKPITATLETLKNNGFRWHKVKKIWYAKNTPERLEIAKSIAGDAEIAEKAHKKSGEANIYDVKVGDIFSSSWGYEQTNSTFFQVIALVGKQSVRVREVWPETISRDPVSQMSEHRVYKLTNKILPPAPYASFIKDQENGDIKRIKPGHYQDKKEAKENCFFNISSYANAHKCNGEKVEVYESWYH